jgi:hypothetical protein
MSLHGKSTKVFLGSVDLSPYLTSADFSVDVDTADTTTFGGTWKTAITGTGGSKVDLGGLYDPTQASLSTLLLSQVPGILTVCPGGGAAIGDSARLSSAIDTSYAESSPVGGVVAVKASLLASSTLGFGYVLHPLAVDTGTTTGANRDDLAASATGWTMHLHVTAVSSGTWTIKLVDASASNFSDVADVTGGSFTATAAATSQRLSSALSTTALRRYVRYVATVAGGSTPTITFALALARN